MKYTMTTPCSLCPFRSDAKQLTVSPTRLAQFASGEFPCHQTAELQEDDDGESGYTATDDSQHCAGLLIMLEKMGRPHQMMRIAERLGMYDASKLNMESPVHDSLRAAAAACKTAGRKNRRKESAQ
jgi:hypothetical protein